MSIDFSSLDFSTEAIKKMREQAQSMEEKEAIELAKKKAACFDVLIVYLDDLRRIRKQYTEYRMYYWDNDPAGYDEPEVSDDENVMDSLIRIMDASNKVVRDQILKPGYFLKDVRELEERMQGIYKADEE